MLASTQLRKGVSGLVRLASADLSSLWRGADTPELVAAALRDVLPPLIATYGAASASLAADWYDEQRDRAAARKHFTAIPAEVPDVGAQALVGWALTEARDVTAFQTLIAGGMQRRIVNFSRLTVAGSSIEDPGARGWQRVGDGNSCAFCSMLLGRGAVYTEATADFQAHDHCGCAAEPVFL